MLKSENISELKQEIKQKHTVAYELDLKNDIDHEKSPHNELKHTEGWCEFVCENGDEIPLGDFEIIFGRLQEKAGHLAGVLREQSFFKRDDGPDNEKLFSAILPLRDEYDIVNIKFRGKIAQRFSMFIYNRDLCQFKKNIKNGVYDNEPQVKKNHIATLQNRFVIFNLDPKNNVSVLVGNKLSQYISFKYAYDDTVSFYLDYKAGNININSQKWREVYNVDFTYLKYLEMYGSFGENTTLSFDNLAFDIYKAIYAKNTGYIYLKPITLPKGTYKVFLYYTGEPNLEYSKGNSGTWRKFPERFRVTEKEDLRLRLKMNSGDKLHDLLIASRNK